MFKVVNIGGVSCTIRGYPSVSVLDARGSTIAFTYSDGPYDCFAPHVTALSPQLVSIDTAGSAFFVIAKYRCDDRHQFGAASIRLGVPGQPRALVTGPFVGQLLPLCSGSGVPDPGQTLQISPIEPSVVAALR